jgi:hypothetical protein
MEGGMKDAVVCFRISKDLRGVLERISKADRRSLSGTIENILHAYAQQRGTGAVEEEKRHHPRKKIAVPALVRTPDGTVHGGMVNDVSLGGLRVSVPEDYEYRLSEDSTISIVFALPESDRPLTMQCVPRHVRADGEKSIGVSFIDGECEGRDLLRASLVERSYRS